MTNRRGKTSADKKGPLGRRLRARSLGQWTLVHTLDRRQRSYFDLVGSRTIRDAGFRAKNIAPQKLTTVSGRIEVSEGAAIRVDELGLHANMLAMYESPSVMSPGRLCMTRACSGVDPSERWAS